MRAETGLSAQNAGNILAINTDLPSCHLQQQATRCFSRCHLVQCEGNALNILNVGGEAFLVSSEREGRGVVRQEPPVSLQHGNHIARGSAAPRRSRYKGRGKRAGVL